MIEIKRNISLNITTGEFIRYNFPESTHWYGRAYSDAKCNIELSLHYLPNISSCLLFPPWEFRKAKTNKLIDITDCMYFCYKKDEMITFEIELK